MSTLAGTKRAQLRKTGHKIITRKAGVGFIISLIYNKRVKKTNVRYI